MKSVLLLLILASSGLYRTRQSTVDLIELNHHYDAQGRPAYDQVIFYEWSPDYSRMHVMAWRLLEHEDMLLTHRGGRTTARWKGNLIVSKSFRETWTYGNDDPERLNKKLMEEKYRTSLLKAE